MTTLENYKLNGQQSYHGQMGKCQMGGLFIRYETYFFIEIFKKNYRCKWDNLIKHQGCRIII
jgi:hypothetical protein